MRGGDLGGGVRPAHRDLGRDEQLLGTEVQGPHVDDRSRRRRRRARPLIRADGLRAGGLADEQRVHLDGRATTRDDDQQQADQQRAEAVPAAVAGDAASARRRAARTPGRSARRCPRAGRPAAPAPWPCGRTPPRSARRGCGWTRASRCGTRTTPARSRRAARRSAPTATALDRLGVLPLVHALVDREQAADAEQHDRDDERVDVALRGRSRTGARSSAARAARLPPMSSSTWLPESASEWIDSASIEREPVSRNATNLVDRDAEVRRERRDDRPGAALGAHSAPLQRVRSRRSATCGEVSGSTPPAEREVDGGEVGQRDQVAPAAPAGGRRPRSPR